MLGTLDLDFTAFGTHRFYQSAASEQRYRSLVETYIKFRYVNK